MTTIASGLLACKHNLGWYQPNASDPDHRFTASTLPKQAGG
jgi:hypothetical protein